MPEKTPPPPPRYYRYLPALTLSIPLDPTLPPDPTDPTDRPSSLTLLPLSTLPCTPPTLQILQIGLAPPPPAPILDPVLIACIDHGESSSYGILRGVGEDTVYPL